MAPHWKCGSRQRVAGSNPALSATLPSDEADRMTRPRTSGTPSLDIVALPMGEFTFRDDDPWPGQTGVVVAYAVRHAGGTFLFDTGIGIGNAEFDSYYRVRAQELSEVLDAAQVDPGAITAIANCHLHPDHSGQNARFPGIPIYVQPAEWLAAHTEPDYAILDWVDFPGARYEQVAGEHEV